MQPDMKISVVRRADAESPGSTKQKIDFRISSMTCMDTVTVWHWKIAAMCAIQGGSCFMPVSQGRSRCLTGRCTCPAKIALKGGQQACLGKGEVPPSQRRVCAPHFHIRCHIAQLKSALISESLHVQASWTSAGGYICLRLQQAKMLILNAMQYFYLAS